VRCAQYWRSLSPRRRPSCATLVHVLYEDVAAAPDTRAEVYRVSCSALGQIVRKDAGRAAVTGVGVKAVHTRLDRARLVWTTSESPDTSWLAFRWRECSILQSDDSTREQRALATADRAVSLSIPSGMERPYS